MSRRRRVLVYTLFAIAQLAIVGNSVAGVLNARRGLWGVAVGHAGIALVIALATLVGWYQMTRQKPHRWRPDDDT